MSASSQIAPTSYRSAVWRPGIRGLLVFVALAAMGFLIWRINPPVALRNLLGVGSDEWFDSPLYSTLNFYLEPAVRCVLALVAGFLFPRGFYLWGLAIVLHTPLSHVLLSNTMREAGVSPYVGDAADVWGYLLLEAVLTVFVLVVYTCFSALGMLSRYLLNGRNA